MLYSYPQSQLHQEWIWHIAYQFWSTVKKDTKYIFWEQMKKARIGRKIGRNISVCSGRSFHRPSKSAATILSVRWRKRDTKEIKVEMYFKSRSQCYSQLPSKWKIIFWFWLHENSKTILIVTDTDIKKGVQLDTHPSTVS